MSIYGKISKMQGCESDEESSTKSLTPMSTRSALMSIQTSVKVWQ